MPLVQPAGGWKQSVEWPRSHHSAFTAKITSFPPLLSSPLLHRGRHFSKHTEQGCSGQLTFISCEPRCCGQQNVVLSSVWEERSQGKSQGNRGAHADSRFWAALSCTLDIGEYVWKRVDLCVSGERGLATADPSEWIRCRLFWNRCRLLTYCEKKIAVQIQRLYLSLWLNMTFLCSWEVKQEENAGRMVGLQGPCQNPGCSLFMRA